MSFQRFSHSINRLLRHHLNVSASARRTGQYQLLRVQENRLLHLRGICSEWTTFEITCMSGLTSMSRLRRKRIGYPQFVSLSEKWINGEQRLCCTHRTVNQAEDKT